VRRGYFICDHHGATIVQEIGTRQERKEMRIVVEMNLQEFQDGVVTTNILYVVNDITIMGLLTYGRTISLS
jgi:hypothetical protein